MKIISATLFPLRSFIVAFVVGICVAVSPAPPSEQPPNIVLFLADDMAYHDLGSYGNQDVRTPNLDRLARQGVRFRYAFNSAPMCAPTRMSLYTGIHPVRNGGHPNHSRVYGHIRSMPHYLEPLGYRVALLGKRHEAPERNFPFEYLGGRHHDDGTGLDLDLEKARAFMTENRNRPWALVVASNQPHSPWNRGDPTAYDAEALGLPPYLVDTEETREALARYYAEITYMDDQVGQVLRSVREAGLEENTIVLFLSEQGSQFPHGKWTCYDTGLRSAALVRWPGIVSAGSASEALIQYVDVLPTLIEAAGGRPDDLDFDGVSFFPVLAGKKDAHGRYTFGVQTSRGIHAGPRAYGIRTVRDRRYRLIWNLNWEEEFRNMVTEHFAPYQSWIAKAKTGDTFARQRVDAYQTRPQYELYNLDEDPYELNNLAGRSEYRAIQHTLKEELDRWMLQQGDRGVETEERALSRQ